MRNIFDQYSQPENQVTHALISCLDEDRALLRRFLRDVAKVSFPKGQEIMVQEQALPGDPERTEQEAARRGLPDAVLHDGEAWCLAIESKVGASPSLSQLRRQYATLERRGFSSIELLLITATSPAPKFQTECRTVGWSEVYSWLRSQQQSEWARRAAEYLEIQEQRLIEAGYLKEGALTEFAGFDFEPDRPYNYLEAKRMLRLAMEELRSITALQSQLGADLGANGRKAITGREGSSVWDFIPLQGSQGDQFTRYPHLTLSIGSERVFAHITIANSISTQFRNNLLSLGTERCSELILRVEQGLRPVLKKAPDAAPWLVAVQRRYASQRSIPIIDALLEFDLRTAVRGEATAKHNAVKSMPEWMGAAFSAWATKRGTGANYQLAVGAIFPFSRCPAVRQPEAIRLIADTWLACKPLLSAIRGKS